MKTHTRILILSLTSVCCSLAQTPVTLFKGTTLPAECSPVDAEVLFFLVNQTSNTGSMYYCSASNTWTQLGGVNPSSGGANANGYYTVTRSTNAPANAFNLGTLGTGILKCTVSGGICTPADAVASDFPVSSVFGRTGAVTAQAGDYTPAQVGAEPALGNPAANGYILSSTTSGMRSWIAPGGGVSASVVPISGTSGTVAFNCSGGAITSFTGPGGNPIQATGNLTVTSSGCTPGQILDFWLEQNGTANYDVTWPAGWDATHLVQAPNVSAHYEYILDTAGIGHYSNGSSAPFDQYIDSATPAKPPPPGVTFTYTKNGTLCRLNSSGGESCL
jgi:hypothetical protein